MSKLIPILNVSAFAEGFFQKSAALGVPPEEALGMFLTKQAGPPAVAAAIPVIADAASKNSGGDMFGKVWDSGGKAISGVGGALGGLARGVLGIPGYLAGLGQDAKDLALIGVGGGAGLGGLAWLMKENAKTEAAKNLAAKQNSGKMPDQQEQLRQAFAVAPEEKVKPYTTVGQDNYEV